MDKKDDTRKRISLEERQHYCQLIENGTGYHAIAEMYFLINEEGNFHSFLAEDSFGFTRRIGSNRF